MTELVLAKPSVPILRQAAPFSSAAFAGEAREGETISAIIERFFPDESSRVWLRVWLRTPDGRETEIEPALWRRVKPRAGVVLVVRVVPEGRFGRGLLRLVAAIAVVAAAAFFGPIVGGYITAATGIGATTANALGSLAVTMVGSLALNALIPPPKPRLGDASRLAASLSGVGNQAVPFGAVPRIYGRVRFAPRLAARVLSENQGQSSYLRAIFDFGYGPLSISDIRIGTTPLAQFSDVETEWRAGWPDDPPITLYPDTVREDGYAMRLRYNVSEVVETRDATREAIVDVTFVGLVRLDGDGRRNQHTVRIRFEWRAVGSGSWTLHAERNVTAATEQKYTHGERIVFPAVGRYELRLTRLTVDSTNASIRDESFLTAVRSVQGGVPVRAKGRALLAMRVKASDQLAGVLDQVSAVVQAILPVWNGTTWSWQETRNPAWAYLDVLRGSANPRPVSDDRLDLPAFLAWAQDCDAAPASGSGPKRELNGVFADRTTVFDALRDIAAAGRAAFGMREGKFSIVRDVPQSVPIQHFTPRNSRSFRGYRVFSEPPHAIRARYVEPAREWSEQEVIVYADGYDETNATRIEEMEWFGVTNRDQAWRETRYAMAVARLRPEVFELTTDIEHLLVTRGDLVRVTHDVPGFGVSSGRVVSVQAENGVVTGFALDERVTFESGKTYAARFRTADGQSLLSDLVTQAGVTSSFQLVTPVGPDFSAASAANLIANPTAAGAVVGSPGTLPTGWTGTGSINGMTRTIVGTGTEDGIPYFDVRYFGTATANHSFIMRPNMVTNVVAGDRFAASVFVRLVGGSLSEVSSRNIVLSAWSVNTFLSHIGTSQPITITTAALRSQRSTINRVLTITNANGVRLHVSIQLSAGTYYDFTLRFGYPQIEKVLSSDSDVTSLIPRIARGDLVLIGEAGRESADLIVREIRPGPDLSATLVLIPAAPEVHDAETSPIPPYDPQATQQPPATVPERPAPPTVSWYSDERALLRAGDGTLLARIAAEITSAASVAGAQIRWRPAGSDGAWSIGPLVRQPPPVTIYTDTVTEGETYEVSARVVSATGVASDWTTPVAHSVVGKTTPPPNVADLRIDGRVLSWPAVSVPDLAGYVIRWARGTVADWTVMVPAHSGVLTASPFELGAAPTGQVSVAIKAVDTGGRESEQATFVFSDIGDPPVRLGLASYSHRANSWPGDRYGAVVSGGDLLAPADTSLPMWSAEPMTAMWLAAEAPMWPSVVWPALAYECDVTFAAPPANARVLFNVRGEGAPMRLLLRPIAPFWSNDGSLMWTSDTALFWPQLAQGEWQHVLDAVPAAALPARLRVEIDGGVVRPVLREVEAILDGARVEETVSDVPLAAAGSRLPLTRTFTAISAVMVTLQGATTARAVRVLDKNATLGPLVQAVDASGNGVAATVDATIIGY